jgi:hypothetical protein
VVSTGILKDDLAISYELPQLFVSLAGVEFIKPEHPHLVEVKRQFPKDYNDK